MIRKRTLLMTGLSLVLMFLMSMTPVMAATNIGSGNLGADPDVPGDNDNITDSAVFTITSTTLAVIKKAFLDDATGTELTSGSQVASGTIVKFMIHIDNSTGVEVKDVRIEDLLNDTDFTYQANSLFWNNMVTNSGATVATIFGNTDGDGANTGVQLSQAVDGDVGSVDAAVSPDRVTMGAHSAQTNGTLNIPAGKIAAFIFRARVN